MTDTPKRILLGVTGGIAAYKSPELVRRLRDGGAEVQVVMTQSAQQFVTPMTFQAVSGRTVRAELWDSAAEAAMGHIELARWAELVMIAPASASFLSQLAAGHASDLLSTVCLATDAPIVVAPAMNRLMWANAATQDNVKTLLSRGVTVLGPGEGDQACGETGPGRMLEPTMLAEEALSLAAASHALQGLKVLLTAGPTHERIDPVRFIGNRSSGKMGFAIARAARAAGAEVTLVSGPVSLPTPPGIRRVSVESAEQMYAAVHAELASQDIFISTAAVADYRLPQIAGQKVKKTANNQNLTLELVRTPDILASVAASADAPFTVGFAAETEKLVEHALAKLHNKKLDMIAANQVGEKLAFDADDNALTVLWQGGSKELPRASKTALARELVELIAERYRARK